MIGEATRSDTSPPHRVRHVIVAAVASIAIVVAGVGWSAQQRQPSLDIPQEVPAEVTELSIATWEAFLEAFPAQRSCIGTVTLRLTRNVEGGDALYRLGEETIYIEIPTTPERYPESLAHELGHHLEHVCAAEAAIGSAFRASQGLSRSVTWSGTDPWYDSPSEHFAESVVQLVLGERLLHPDIVEVESYTLDIVSAWATGIPLG